jgi:hypothetical protein
MARARHPKKEIEAAIQYAEASGWRVAVGGSHAWGKLYCPYNEAECRCGQFCITSIWSTPRNPGNYARKLRRVVDNCAARTRLARSAGEASDSE